MPEAIRSNTQIKQKNKIFIDILGAYLFLASSIVAPSTLYAIDDRLLVYSYITVSYTHLTLPTKA